MKKYFIIPAFLTIFFVTLCNSQITNNPLIYKCSLYNHALIGNVNNYSITLILNRYFALKNALVNSNSLLTSEQALALHKSLRKISIKHTSQEEYKACKIILKRISKDAKRIAHTSRLKYQRIYFINLSKNLYNLQKKFEVNTSIYYMFCPMTVHRKGATWLSLEKEIRNPYYGYGHQMLDCGIILEVIN
jgi:hypothetical protein